MGRVILRQDNGLFAIWSSIVDNFVWVNCTREEVYKTIAQDAAEGTRQGTDDAMARVDKTGTSSRMCPDRLVSDLLEEVRERHGQKEYDDLVTLMAKDIDEAPKDEGPWIYTKHHRDHAEGSIYISDAPEEVGCKILLTGTASMSQEEMDTHGRLIVGAVNAHLRRTSE